jgi:hypothetical protein
MKYILLMFGSKAGVSAYRAWPQTARDAHMQALQDIVNGLNEAGEFVATQPLAEPNRAKIVRGEQNGLPITDGVFPEAKEFLLGYWIVDVATAERAYAIAGKISAAPGPGGIPTNVPIEVRAFVESRTARN